jgi:superoxide dismutase, Fe-Mn family
MGRPSRSIVTRRRPSHRRGAPHAVRSARTSLPQRRIEALSFAETLEYRHDKHHAAHVTQASNLLTDNRVKGKSLKDVVKESYGVNVPRSNNAAQHYNHSEYWKSIKPNGGGNIPGKPEKALVETFGSIEKVKQGPMQTGTTQFDSARAWLSVKEGEISVGKTVNAENPLLSRERRF